MANVEHVAIVKQGAEAIRQWQTEHPEECLDLYEADLAEAALRSAHLERADLREAHLAGAHLEEANLVGAHLERADLREAHLERARLAGAHLAGAHLVGAHLQNTYLYEANLHKANLRNAHLERANLQNAHLDHADLRNAHLERADLQSAHLKHADLRNAHLERADLRHADLTDTDLRHADLREAILSGAVLTDVRNAFHAHALETIQIMSNDALYFDKCKQYWTEKRLDWECLRTMGRLPLFGVSYTALILIPIVFYALDLYNEQVNLIRAWFEQVRIWTEQTPDLPIHIANLLKQLTPAVLEHLHPRPIPSQSFFMLIATVLLAVASTLYIRYCPSRIKEFSRTQWCDQLNHSLIHYWPLAWTHRYVRLTCAVCYGVGALIAGYVLLTKLVRVGAIIYKNSSFSALWW